MPEAFIIRIDDLFIEGRYVMDACIRWRILSAIAALFVLSAMSGAAFFQETSLSPLIPPQAFDAIKRSQGQLLIEEKRFDGKIDRHLLSAFLVSKKKRLILTTLHGLPLPMHSAQHPDLIKFFREIPAPDPQEKPKGVLISCTLKQYLFEHDVAILELAQVPEDMQEVTFAKDVPIPSKVYAALFGMDELKFELSKNATIFFRWLPFYGTIVLEVPIVRFENNALHVSPDSFFYIFGSGGVKGGFSGTVFVNEHGEVVGMGRFGDDGYSGIISVKTITRFLAETEQEDDSKR